MTREGYAYEPVKYYDKIGLTDPIRRVYFDTLQVTTSDGFTVDLTHVNFSIIRGWAAIPVKNTSTSTAVPNVSGKTVGVTSLVLNFTEGNSSIVSILGSGVLLGPSNSFANTTGLYVVVIVWGR